jgi:hypothetical protein
MDTIRLEEFTGVIQNKVITVWSADGTGVGTGINTNPWLPTEFLLAQYITRILVVGRTSPVSLSLAADSSWTQVWRLPGGKEWACLLGILEHMPGPVLLVVGPDVTLSPKVVGALKGVTTVVIRSSLLGMPVTPDHVFFPVLTSPVPAHLNAVIQECLGRSVPRALDLKTLIPQLAAQGYGLTVAEGVWHWYKPADSAPLVTLTVAQIAKQMQILGTTLEKMTV